MHTFQPHARIQHNQFIANKVYSSRHQRQLLGLSSIGYVQVATAATLGHDDAAFGAGESAAAIFSHSFRCDEFIEFGVISPLQDFIFSAQCFFQLNFLSACTTAHSPVLVQPVECRLIIPKAF